MNIPLRTLIGFAYQEPPFMLLGGPEWVANDRFDIVAKLEGDPPVVAPGSSVDGLTMAMRTLLAERFALKVHRETREMDIYALVMARPDGRPGSGLRPSAQDCSPEGIRARTVSPPPAAPSTTSSPICGMQAAPGRIQFGGLPLSQLTANLGGQAGRLVVDRTGLTGAWDFELTFAAEPPRGPLPAGVDPPRADPDGTSIFTALQEQLGLKLDATKGPVEVLIIDSVEQPTPD